ncbi:hypothetical protein JCM3774_001840 [Rhodotorula dairenensis]
MEESPWGAPDDAPAVSLPRRPPSPDINISAATSSFALSAPTWGGEDDAWGGGSSAYVPATVTASGFGEPERYGAARDEPLTSFSNPTVTGQSPAWPTEDDPERSNGGRLDVRISQDEPRGYEATALPSLHATDDFAPIHQYESTDTYRHAEDTEPVPERGESDDRGWGGASPDLPPISSLRLASPASPVADERAAGWSPEEVDEFDVEPPPPPLPTVDEVFASAKPRRESVELKKAAEGGGDAWGSSQGWEERMRAEAEARAKERGDEPEPEKAEGEKAAEDTAPTRSSAETPRAGGGLSSILGKFRKGAEDTAARSTEVAKDVAGAASRTAGQLAQSAADVAAQAQQAHAHGGGDAKPAAAKSSWFGRKTKPAEEQAAAAAETTSTASKPIEPKEDDPYTLGVEEVEMGGSGRATAEEPAQPTAIGRFFSRLKRAPSSNPDDDVDKASSPRASSETPGSIRPDELDILAHGRLGSSQTPATTGYGADDFDPQPVRSGLFGSRSKASSAQVPMAPPEDDFGGLIGALSAAPTRPVRRAAGPKPFDPFDPLSDNFGAVPAIPALNKPKSAPATRAGSVVRPSRPVAPLSPPPRPASAQPATQTSIYRAPKAVASFPLQASSSTAPRNARLPSEQDDEFDDFFDAATASSAPSADFQVRAGSATHPSAPASVSTASPLFPAAGGTSAAKPRVAPPPPRMTISPPARHSTASPASSIGSASGRATTPILPLPPPPPPSQPIAGSARGGGILVPPPPPFGNSSSALPSPTLATPASKPKLPPPLTASMSSAPLAPSPTLSQSSKPSTPLTPSNAQRPPTSGPLSLDDLSFFEA